MNYDRPSPPLKGVRIVELTTMITGPLCGMLLADMGADVIKIEAPGGGDPFRTFKGGSYSPHFIVYNRNKRSLTLDLKSASGRNILERLLEDTDVLIENFRPGVMEKLGFSYDRLRDINPRLISCSITGFGRDGPYAQRPAYDAVAQALSGMSSLFVDPSDPQLSGPTISDNITGIFAAYGIQAALYRRERTGEGGRVDTNMLAATMAFMPDPFAYVTQLSEVPDRLTRVTASQSYVLRCADERLLAVHLSSQPKFWTQLATALEAPSLVTEQPFKERDERMAHYGDVIAALNAIAARHPRAYWMERLTEHDVPFAPVNSVSEAMDDPQVRHLDCFFSIQHPRHGAVRGVRRPVWIDGVRDDQPLSPPPDLGEHNEEILSALGFESHTMKRQPEQTGAKEKP